MADIYGFDDSKSKVLIKGEDGIEIVDGVIGHTNSVTEQTTFVGTSTKIPKLKFDKYGHITGVDTVDIYPPTTPGNSGEVWTSDGIGVGSWKSLDHKQDKITISTSDPSGGTHGDIWLKYE